MNKKDFIIKILALALTLASLLTVLCSCYSAPMDKAVVGTVGDKDVYYDELYYLTFNNMDYVKAYCDGNEKKMKEMMDNLIHQQIIQNFAKVSLYESAGLKLSDITSYDIDKHISEQYSDDRDVVADDREKNGMSERYHRYTVQLELLEEGLTVAYREKLPKDNELKAYIKENFVRYYHIVRYVDNSEEDAKEKDKINAAISEFNNSTPITKVVGKYTENTDNLDIDGYVIDSNTLNETVKNAIMSLKEGEISEPIETEGFNNSGVRVKCYNVYQRCELSDEYIEEKYESMKIEYINAQIDKDYQKIYSSLKFTPNKAYKELDLLNLEKPEKTVDTTVIVIIIIVAVVVAAGVTVAVILKNKYKKKNASYTKTSKSVTKKSPRRK